jgi:hypothetical protein
MKPKKKDVETNTDQTFDFQQQQRRFFDEKGKVIFILNIHLSSSLIKKYKNKKKGNQFVL